MARKTTKRILIALGVAGLLGALWLTAVVVSEFSGGFSTRGTSAADFEEEYLETGSSGDKIAMINLVGEIFSDPQNTARGASDTNIITRLRHAADDPAVTGIILNLETPGGGVLASDSIYQAVREIREEMPVVALMGNVAASGGYYIAAGATEIVAHPYTWTGSIGVIATIPNVEEAAGKLGVTMNVIKSGELKDLGSPFRPLTDQESQIFQGLIDEAYAGFVEIVAEGRGLSLERTRELADGRIYSGLQAKELGLIDHLGDRDTAFERAKSLADSPEASLVVYRPIIGLLEALNPFAISSPADEVVEELGLLRNPGASYLWIP
ncbi:MAG: signal peptide peptidase SppA [Actinomycetota bacterium]